MVSGHDDGVWIERRDLGDVAADQFTAMDGGFDDAPPGRSRWDVFDDDGRFLGAKKLRVDWGRASRTPIANFHLYAEPDARLPR